MNMFHSRKSGSTLLSNPKIIAIEGADGLGKTHLFDRMKLDLRNNKSFVFQDSTSNYFRRMNNENSPILDKKTLYTLERQNMSNDLSLFYNNSTHVVFDRYSLSNFIYYLPDDYDPEKDDIFGDYLSYTRHESELGIIMPYCYIILTIDDEYIDQLVFNLQLRDKVTPNSDLAIYGLDRLKFINNCYKCIAPKLRITFKTIDIHITNKTNSTDQIKKIKREFINVWNK